MIDCLNHGALQGELSISQRQGIISLIPKKEKDLLSLKNWRPISLLNTDYKIAIKCIAKRLEEVIKQDTLRADSLAKTSVLFLILSHNMKMTKE